MKPVRIQLSRAKGSKLTSPNGLAIVKTDRTTKWGNPFKLKPLPNRGRYALGRRRALESEQRTQIVEMYKIALLRCTEGPWPALRDSLNELRGKNLACWCRPGDVCHADVLLELANA